MTDETYLDGQFLIAMPNIGDPRFARSVVYMCAHTDQGAMGLIINHRAEGLDFATLLEQLGILPGEEQIRLPAAVRSKPVLIGGPVEPARGFVLHTADYHLPDGTLNVTGSIGLTATMDILQAIAAGAGPRRSLLALGYAGWSAGQLEAEIADNGWLTCAADEDILFDAPMDDRYEKALARLGIGLGNLSSGAGHA